MCVSTIVTFTSIDLWWDGSCSQLMIIDIEISAKRSNPIRDGRWNKGQYMYGYINAKWGLLVVNIITDRKEVV